MLPTRKNPRSTKLTIASIKADYNPEKQWIFPTKVLDKTEIKKVVARVVEIATRSLFSYKFGGKHFEQKKGGPIGVRATGAAAELVMQACSILEKGMRFSEQENKFSFSKEAELGDARLEKMGESKNQRMARVCQPAMNSINPDLVFTVESQEDFEKERLPTLDFEIWQMEDGTLNHSYFQKQMKTPYVIMARSAMPIQQKIQILGNELTRRLSNVNKERVGQEEILEIIEQFTKELKNSEYTCKQAKEIITSGIRGWARKIARRQRDGQEFYRHSKTTLQTRIKKKLIERETWYKNRQEDSEDEDIPPNPRSKYQEHKKDSKKDKNTEKEPVRAVMFVPNTPHSGLAKELRKLEEKLVGVTKKKFKII